MTLSVCQSLTSNQISYLNAYMNSSNINYNIIKNKARAISL